jgi:hypothetical protein
MTGNLLTELTSVALGSAVFVNWTALHPFHVLHQCVELFRQSVLAVVGLQETASQFSTL